MSLFNPWFLLGLVLAFAGAGYGGYTKGKAAQLAVDKVALQTERLEAAQNAAKAREGWVAMVAARDADIAALHASHVESDAKYQRSIASARRAADAISRGVTASVRANPQDPALCSLSDDTFRLLNEQIEQANVATGQIAGAPVSGLPGEFQGCPVDSLAFGVERVRGAGRGLRLASQDVCGAG